MAINSVNLASSAAQQQQPVSARQMQPQSVPPPPERSREGSDAANIRAPQPTVVQSPAQERRPEQAERVEQPKPVVNAQGQKTGTIISTAA